MTHGNHSSAVFNVFYDIKKYLINSSCFILNSIYNSTVITLYNSSLAMSHIQRPFSAHNDMRRQLNLHSHLYLYMNVRTREDTTQINYEPSRKKYAIVIYTWMSENAKILHKLTTSFQSKSTHRCTQIINRRTIDPQNSTQKNH